MARRKRMIALLVLSSGMTLASGCVAEQVIATIATAFRIVDIWV